jgi:hypothetical protein
VIEIKTKENLKMAGLIITSIVVFLIGVALGFCISAIVIVGKTGE